MMRMRRRWTKDEVAFLSGHCDTPRAELTDLFNAKFHPAKKHDISSLMVRRGFLMEKSEGWHRKAGRKPRPIGSTYIAGGFIKVRTEDGWKYLHHVNWEAKHGPIPVGSVLVHLSGDKLDCRPENWRMVTKSERAMMVTSPVPMSDADAEIREALIGLAKLKMKIKQKGDKK